MTKIQIVVLSIIRYKEKYLLTLRKDSNGKFDGKWQIPGGGLEFGETPTDCLHRETMEELGIKVNVVALLPKVDSIIRGFWQGIFISYVCEMKDTNAEIVLNEEATEYGWFTLEQMKHIEMIPGGTEILVHVMKVK